MDLDTYYNLEENFYNVIHKKVGEDLIFYCVTGSLGRNDIILGWSDIDILIVFNECSSNSLFAIKQALSENKTDIKIGTTFYSKDEFMNLSRFKDPKTWHALEHIKNGIYKPKLLNGALIIPEASKDVLIQFDVVDEAKYLHNIRRELIDIQSFNERSVYKQIISVTKIELYRRGVVCMSYIDTINEAKNRFSGYPATMPTPEEIINFSKDKSKRYNTYIEFLNWIKECSYA